MWSSSNFDQAESFIDCRGLGSMLHVVSILNSILFVWVIIRNTAIILTNTIYNNYLYWRRNGYKPLKSWKLHFKTIDSNSLTRALKLLLRFLSCLSCSPFCCESKQRIRLNTAISAKHFQSRRKFFSIQHQKRSQICSKYEHCPPHCYSAFLAIVIRDAQYSHKIDKRKYASIKILWKR